MNNNSKIMTKTILWIAYVKQADGKAVVLKLGKFPDCNSATKEAEKRFGSRLVLVEPK